MRYEEHIKKTPKEKRNWANTTCMVTTFKLVSTNPMTSFLGTTKATRLSLHHKVDISRQFATGGDKDILSCLNSSICGNKYRGLYLPSDEPLRQSNNKLAAVYEIRRIDS